MDILDNARAAMELQAQMLASGAVLIVLSIVLAAVLSAFGRK